jgi:hypothetical protein
MLIKEGNEGNVDDGNSGYERLHARRPWHQIKQRNAGEGARATQSLNNYLVSIFRLMLTVGRVSNWLTVLVSLLRLWYWA